MKISIITITYNSESTLEETLQSVIGQDYEEIEYIIVDGASTDKTLNLIEDYKTHIDKIVSEKDKGLYHALNKGIALASGEVVGILHSDDTYSSPTVISSVMHQFITDPSLEGLYADLTFVDRDNVDKVRRLWKSGAYREGMFLKGWMPPHPTFFVRRSVYERYGAFDTSFRLSADYELMLRFIHKQKIRIAYLPESIVKMKMGGVSNTSIKGKIKANREDSRAWKVNGLEPGLFTTIRKPLSKLMQYLQG